MGTVSQNARQRYSPSTHGCRFNCICLNVSDQSLHILSSVMREKGDVIFVMTMWGGGKMHLMTSKKHALFFNQ